ncbi:hypothetical protein OSL33_16450, partial [Escherichia coli]|nr:hypothetical protein [Escherichia coli]
AQIREILISESTWEEMTCLFAPSLGVMYLLSGCTALLWGVNKVAEPKTERHIQIQDSVTGVFQYKNLAVSVVQGSKKLLLTFPLKVLPL